jgi:hypothetical protein
MASLRKAEVRRMNDLLITITRNRIVSDYGLDNRAIGVRSLAGAKYFSSILCYQTQPPFQWVPGVISPGVKRGRGVMLTTHTHLVPRS